MPAYAGMTNPSLGWHEEPWNGMPAYAGMTNPSLRWHDQPWNWMPLRWIRACGMGGQPGL